MSTIQPGHSFAASGPCLLLFCGLAACKGPRLSEELPANESHRAAQQNAPSAGAETTALPLAPGAPGERPSVDQNMGRGFQGSLVLRVHDSRRQDQELRYLSLGNTARLQIDTLGDQPRNSAPQHFDALIWGESISLIDHQRRAVRTLPLRQLRPKAEPEVSVATNRTGERTSLQGVYCEQTQLQQGDLHIDACVAGLPGTFAVDELETVSGLDVPAWVEQLLKDEQIPLRARVRDAAGKELYSLELVQYAPGPVDPQLLVVPENYAPENPRTMDGALGSIGR
ncbi:MAG: hypothetical protein RL033_7024 [Pseudomonadota bacterium]